MHPGNTIRPSALRVSLASSEICLIDSAKKIRDALPIAKQEMEPEESAILN